MRRACVAVLLFSAFPLVAGVNTWTAAALPGGTIWKIAVTPSAPSIIWAATEAGLFKSIDSGATWTIVSSGPTGVTITGIEFHPTTPSTMYVSTSNHGVWKSTNSGAAWSRVSSGLPQDGFNNIVATEFDAISAITIDPTDGLTLYAASIGSIYKTTNAGASWDWWGHIAEASITSLVVDPANHLQVYATLVKGSVSAVDGVYKSIDGGENWSAMNSGLLSSTLGYRAWEIAVDSSTSPSTLYVATNLGLARRTTTATTWTQILTTVDGTTPPSTATFSVEVFSSSIIYAGSVSRIYKTTNGGTSWTSQTTTLSGSYYGALAVDRTNAANAYAGNNSDLFRTTNGGTNWSTSSTGLNAVGIRSVTYNPVGNTLIAGASDRMFRSSDGGATWNRIAISTFDGWDVIGLSNNGNTVYAIIRANSCRVVVRGSRGVGGYIVKSTDGGTTWNTPYDFGITFSSILSVAVHPADANLVYVTFDNYVFKSANGGGIWTNVTGTAAPGLLAAPIAFHPTNPSIVYIGGSAVLWKTTDGGATWVGKTQFDFAYEVTSIAIDPTNSNHLFLGTTVLLYESNNAGDSFVWSAPLDMETVPSDYSELYAQSILFDPSAAGTMYMATRLYGVMKTTDGALSWTFMNSGLTDPRVKNMVRGASDNYHAATEGSGVFNYTKGQSGPAPVLTATATSTSSVAVSWTSTGASSYVLERAEVRNGTYVTVATLSGTSFTDTGRLSNRTYLYRVHDAAAGSSNSNTDLATTTIHQDDPLLAGVVVKFDHLLKIRFAVDAVRFAAGLSSASFTGGPGATIAAIQIQELRTQLGEALTLLGKTVTYTDAGVTAGTTVRWQHYQELRDATK